MADNPHRTNIQSFFKSIENISIEWKIPYFSWINKKRNKQNCDIYSKRPIVPILDNVKLKKKMREGKSQSQSNQQAIPTLFISSGIFRSFSVVIYSLLLSQCRSTNDLLKETTTNS